MKRHLAELRENVQQTPPVFGKRSRHFRASTPIPGIADFQDDPQADTPDSVRPADMVPSTTEKLLAGFTLNTPIAGLRLQTPPAGAGHPSEDQENGLPWLQHSQAPSSPGQQQQQQLQRLPQLSFRLADRGHHGTCSQEQQQSWFGAPPAGQQQQPHQALAQQHRPPQQHQQPPPRTAPQDQPCSNSQQSLSLGHLAMWGSQQQKPLPPPQQQQQQQNSDGVTPGRWSGGFGSQQPVEDLDPGHASLQDDAHGGRGSQGAAARGAGEGGGGGGGAVVEAGPGRQGSSGQEGAEAHTPLGAWADRAMQSGAQAGDGLGQHQHQQQQPGHKHEQQHPQPPHPQRHRAPPHRPCGQYLSPLGRSPLGLSPPWQVEGLLGDSGSRAEAAACGTPLSEDDFVLKASTSYTRAAAVRSPPLAAQPYADVAAVGGRGGAVVAAAAAVDDDEYHTPLHPGSQDPLCSDAVTRMSGMLPPGQCSEAVALTLTAEETTTPELECLGAASQDPLQSSGAGSRGGEQEATTSQALFPIFRPRNQRKCILLVRHGESTYNKLDAESRSWSDPPVFDAPLTARGHCQAAALRDPLHKMVLKRLGETGASEALWLVSPLTRAIETFLGSCPHVADGLRGAAAGGGGSGSSTPGGSGTPGGSDGSGGSGGGSGGGGDGAGPSVVVLSMIAEHCATSGDVGRPSSDLARAFPVLASPLRELEEVWWYNPDPNGRPNCHRRKRLGRPEPKDHMRQRIAEFSRWLHARPERVIVAFGHSQFWKAFSNSRTSLRNCEFASIWW
ncbi:MAG: hypothetical protein J3K34DRAFT_519225 [Monoraphidium minutum]|nr:MAG: hypothetical protein J3K34DRAFT_519225 [Monoraphidium minutum]